MAFKVRPIALFDRACFMLENIFLKHNQSILEAFIISWVDSCAMVSGLLWPIINIALVTTPSPDPRRHCAIIYRWEHSEGSEGQGLSFYPAWNVKDISVRLSCMSLEGKREL